MNKQDSIETLFKNLEGQFDTEMPNKGHEARFLQKLQQVKDTPEKRSGPITWTILAVAASFALIISIGLGVFNTTGENTADPEFKKTEYYFASVLRTEIEKLEAEKDPVTAKLVEDTMTQLNKLEGDYKNLEKALQQPGDQSMILHAMITNFQTRINLLQDVLIQIEEIKKLKNNSDENNVI
ncbi:hypothetical protein [Robertkochia flava]|uniref:hypothetical protein n=1 Tax=Robertkochia flava TaxID=3447986 RepID=UPI001CC96236|nr:hypothetical protein [Robertkochia marina]